jgi:hypothetical protein
MNPVRWQGRTGRDRHRDTKTPQRQIPPTGRNVEISRDANVLLDKFALFDGTPILSQRRKGGQDGQRQMSVKTVHLEQGLLHRLPKASAITSNPLRRGLSDSFCNPSVLNEGGLNDL